MNDRFKFRHWDKQINKMRYGDIQLGCNGIPFTISVGNVIQDIDDVITMQCTGLKDKNGTLIYEGDIVIYTTLYCGNLTGEVYWDSETLQYKLKLLYSSGEIYADRDLVHFVNKNGLEKVGNIYENKEWADKEIKLTP